jgi:hypothetical protein
MEENILPSVYTHFFLYLPLSSFSSSCQPIQAFLLFSMFNSSDLSSDGISPTFSSPDGKSQGLSTSIINHGGQFSASFPFGGDIFNSVKHIHFFSLVFTDILQPNMGFNTMPSYPSHQMHQILQNASQADLVSSGNGAFQKLWITNIKLEAELKGLRYI